MDPVHPPQQYDPQYRQQYHPHYRQQYDPRQYDFPSRPVESLHIREDAVEPALIEDFTPLALGDVVPPRRYTPGSVVSYFFYNLVNANDKKI
jgi:hypothetical protein